MARLTSIPLWLAIFSAHVACGRADDFAAQRGRMVAEEIAAYGVSDERVLDSMRTTPRHEFVPAGFREQAYFDAALPIGDAQTISPPYVVATMTEALDPRPDDRVLEIGTGSGYQAAVLSPLVSEVYTIEIVEQLAERAERTLKRLGYENIQVRAGDGFAGWPEAAPFDKIIVTCSPEEIPAPLAEQLREDGVMIIPVGERYQQNLVRVTKKNGELVREPLQATLFVPMTGAAEEAREVLPDPNRPGIVNGGFEATAGGDRTFPLGWHYLRQATVVGYDRPTEGIRYLSLSNREAGKPSQALQGMAVDGRRVKAVRLSAFVRGKDLKAELTARDRPALLITFYDRRRAAIATETLGPWEGTFDWRNVATTVKVPPAAREAIVRLTLAGATGRLDLDEISLQSVSVP